MQLFPMPRRLNWACASALIALLLTGCSGISRPASVEPIPEIVGTALPGARGLEVEDQDRIDITVARVCAIEGYSDALCRQHTAASRERRAALAAPDCHPVEPGVQALIASGHDLTDQTSRRPGELLEVWQAGARWLVTQRDETQICIVRQGTGAAPAL